MRSLAEFFVIVLAGVAVSIIVRGINAEIDAAMKRKQGVSRPAPRFTWGRDKKEDER